MAMIFQWDYLSMLPRSRRESPPLPWLAVVNHIVVIYSQLAYHQCEVEPKLLASAISCLSGHYNGHLKRISTPYFERVAILLEHIV